MNLASRKYWFQHDRIQLQKAVEERLPLDAIERSFNGRFNAAEIVQQINDLISHEHVVVR